MAGASAKLGTVLVGLAAWCSGVAALDEVESVHVAFCAECKADMDWKSAGLYHSFHTSGMRGRITRLLACSEEQLAKYPKEALEMGPTYVHRNYRTHPRVPNDHSGSYNKVSPPSAQPLAAVQQSIAQLTPARRSARTSRHTRSPRVGRLHHALHARCSF